MRYKSLPLAVRDPGPGQHDRPTVPPPSGTRDRVRTVLATLPIVLLVPALIVPLLMTSAAGPTLAVAGTPTPGAELVVTGAGFAPADQIELRWDGSAKRVASATVDPGGTFRTAFRISRGAGPGDHRLDAVRRTSGGKKGVEIVASLRVVVGASAPDATSAPTGDPTPDPSLVAVVDPTPPPASIVTPPSPTPTPTPATAAPASPAPTAAATPAPTQTPAAPAPTSGATPAPTATASPAPTPTPTAPPPPPPSSGDYLIMSRAALLARPMSGSAWTSLKATADGSWSSPSLADQNNKADSQALAGALVYARTGDTAYRTKVIGALEAMWKGPWATDMLALARQTGGWVMAADLVGYRDPGFVSWLAAARTRVVNDHPRWTNLHFTAGNSSNNYGTFALTAMIAIDRYLGDAAGLTRDWQIFKGYGDGSWTFQPTAGYQAAWNCGSYQAIESRNCATPTGLDQNGAPVEDASRSTYPTPHGGYVIEAMQGFSVQALLLDRAGYDAWGVNDRQILRVAQFQLRFGIWNYHSVGAYISWIINDAYGVSFPTQPAGYGRTFGFTDWLFG